MKYVIKVKLGHPVSQEDRKVLVGRGFDISKNGISVTGLSEDFDNVGVSSFFYPVLKELDTKVKAGNYEWL